MSSTYQTSVRIFVFIGLAAFCLLVTALIILTPWLRMATAPLASSPTPVATSAATSTVKNTQGEWVVLHEVALPAANMKVACRGRYEDTLPGWEGIAFCLDEFKLTALPVNETVEQQILNLNASSGLGIFLADAKQLGAADDKNARFLFRIEGGKDCENEITGCGYNYTLKVADLKTPTRLQHFTNSAIETADAANWNSTFTKGFGFVGICEGGCIPEPLVGWSITNAKQMTLTDEEAYLGQEHYDQRIPELDADLYKHWGEVKWIDDTHIEAELVDEQGKITKLRREVK